MNKTCCKKMFSVPPQPKCASFGLLVLRAVVGVAFVLHGWFKIQNPMSWMGPDASVPGVFQALAALSEVGGGAAWVLGLVMPLASFGILCTMSVALVVHVFLRGDPFVSSGGSSYELALVYFSVAFLLILAGPGRFSLDRKIFGERQ